MANTHVKALHARKFRWI